MWRPPRPTPSFSFCSFVISCRPLQDTLLHPSRLHPRGCSHQPPPPGGGWGGGGTLWEGRDALECCFPASLQNWKDFGNWETRLADQVMPLGSLGGARNSQAGGSQPGVVISSSRGDRQDVINKTNLPKSSTSLAYFMWFGEAGAPPCTPRA